VDAFSPERKPQGELFEAFRYFLFLLERRQMTESLLSCFEAKLLALVGYALSMKRCTVCQRPIDGGGNFFFVPEAGGVKCEPCLMERDRVPIPVSLGTMKTLHLAQSVPVEKLEQIRLSPRACREGRMMLSRFIPHVLGKELKVTKVRAQFELE